MEISKNTWAIEGKIDHTPQDANGKQLFTYKFIL